ncbi:MAG: ATP phosphoribosyltransferase regulatory subunit [Planctomycetota bacterium]
MSTPSFQRPTGTRDLYPEDLLRRRYITETWRRVSLRHGFDEIDGPTFEHLQLYTVKSGEGIVSELFSFQRQGGDDTYALRPEFTPTLARMYAARAAQLPRPTRWFCIPTFFRAERPQRGRLREFLQWNVDVLGLPGGEEADAKAAIDAECMGVGADALLEFGFSASDMRIMASDRQVIERLLGEAGVGTGGIDAAFALLDKRPKMKEEAFGAEASKIGLDVDAFDAAARAASSAGDASLGEWVEVNHAIVRGLAYYTGTVFEVIAEGERAVAGGGRYDKLVELLGGPATPAVGFAMGDVVLGNLLDDKNLMPKGTDLLRALDRRVPTCPEVFVVTTDDEGAQAALGPTLSALRRGVVRSGVEPWHPERHEVEPLHARRTYKSTKNVGKLLKEANQCGARYVVILESATSASVKDLEGGAQETVAIEDLGAVLGRSLGV